MIHWKAVSAGATLLGISLLLLSGCASAPPKWIAKAGYPEDKAI